MKISIIRNNSNIIFFSILGYKHYVTKWFNVLMPKIDPFLYGNGGNIIMVQV